MGLPKRSDGVFNKALKEFLFRAIAVFTNIFHGALRLRHFPFVWKITDFVTVLKPGQSGTSPQSYSHISVLPIIEKIFEKTNLNRLSDIVEEKNVILNEHLGHYTKHQVLRLVEYATEGFSVKTEYCMRNYYSCYHMPTSQPDSFV